jgi:anaerobic selenocysteine-containing dehydrogenase
MCPGHGVRVAIRTVCSYCGVGCGLEVRTTDGPAGPVIAEVTGDRLHPTNRGRLCTKGLTHAELMGSTEGRALTALMRPHRAAAPVPVGVDDAVTAAGRRLREILDTHGPDAVALYVSGQLSLEAQYLATKLAKGFIRTRYLEANSRLCMAGAATGYKQSLGADGPPGSYDDIDAADLFLVSGANMADCHPILFLRMADRLRAGARLIVVDPRRTATADLFLQLRAGTDLALLNGLLHLLVADGAVDTDFIAAHTEGWEAMPAFLADYPPHRVAAITGLREADIRTAAAMIAEAGPAWMSLWTMGLNQSTHGTWNTNAVCNLHLATGAICRPGAGPLSLTGQPNAMGGREMGYLGPGLPGQRSVTSPADRAFVEAVWNLPPGTIRAETNQGTVDLFDRLADGTVRACWIICTNPAASLPNRDRVIAGLRAADLVVAQDAYADTATNRHADIVLPAAMWGEADGVMVNSERTLTLARAAVPPAGDARPDWRLICDVAAAMGFGAHFDYADSAEVFDELRRFANPVTGYDLRGVDYQRLSAGPVQWPCPPGDPARPAPDPLPRDRPAAVPDPLRAGGVPAAPAHRTARTPRRELPAGAQHRPVAASVAHHDQDRPGGHPQPARRRAVRGTAPRRRGRARDHRRPGRRARLAARPGGAAGGGHRPGAAGQLFRAVPLERRPRPRPHRQRGHQPRRRPGLAAARAEGVRGAGPADRPGRAAPRSHPAAHRHRPGGAVGLPDRQRRATRRLVRRHPCRARGSRRIRGNGRHRPGRAHRGVRAAGGDQHIRRRRPARCRRPVLGPAARPGRPGAGRPALRGAGHRRPQLRPVLRLRGRPRRPAGRARCGPAGRARRLRDR